MNDWIPRPQERSARPTAATPTTRKVAVVVFAVALLVALALVVAGLAAPAGTTGFFYIALIFVGVGDVLLLQAGLIAASPRSRRAARGGVATVVACVIVVEALASWFLYHLASLYGGTSVGTGQLSVACAAAAVTAACGIGAVIALWRALPR